VVRFNTNLQGEILPLFLCYIYLQIGYEFESYSIDKKLTVR